MIHYHGTPCGGQRDQAAKFLAGRHALIPFYRPEDVSIAAEVCQSFCFDNGAYSAWKSGVTLNWFAYYDFCDQWHRHPAFDWAIIPDVIDGTEQENDELLDQWPSHIDGVPVYHMHESFDRLERIVRSWPRVALGSSGEYATVGDDRWWARMSAIMRVVCNGEGQPRCKLHGLRMLDPAVFTRLPLASADSTNAVRNASNYVRFGTYMPTNHSTRLAVIAERIERHQSAAVWSGIESDEQFQLFGGGE